MDKMPNYLLALCPDFFVVILHFVRLNFFWLIFKSLFVVSKLVVLLERLYAKIDIIPL